MINFTWIKYPDLSLNQLYSILQLRAEVFVVEQKCYYLDPDGEDEKALHLLGLENNSLQAYLRLFPPTEKNDTCYFGRVLTAKSARSKGLGKKLIYELINYCDEHYKGKVIKCSAQYYLKKFYESFGFKVIDNNIHDDAGIPHILMQK